jgi:hypothetical protein
MDEWAQSALAWELADEIGFMFAGHERDQLYATIGAGHCFAAIDTMLQVAAQEHRTVRVELVAKIADWLAGYIHNSEAPPLNALLCAVSPT